MRKAIRNIGEKVIERFFDFESNGYELVGGVCEPHNGICEADSLSIYFIINVGGHDIDCSINMDGYKVNYLEAIFEDYGYENIEKALNEYIWSALDTKSLFDNAIDDMRKNSLDEWQAHGFRNEADYNRYRYSA